MTLKVGLTNNQYIRLS